MKIKLLDVVALKHDVPELDLREGDAATVIELYKDGEIELEFIADDGYTIGLLQLAISDVRKPTEAEIGRHLSSRPGEPFMERLEGGKLWVRSPASG